MKKVIKVLLYTFSALLILVFAGSTVLYNRYKPNDPASETNFSSLGYFQESYEQCRMAFRNSSQKISIKFDSVKTGIIKVSDSKDQDLCIDWCYVPARGPKTKLLIITSGVHGIEGFTGNAVQAMFMERFLTDNIPEDMGVLLIHGLNPYGFKYHRKATANNVDLNRNCIPDKNFNLKNDGYAKLTGFLMPAVKVDVSNNFNTFFHLIAIYKIIRESMPVLRQAALQGQYEYEKGIYYGGKTFEPQIEDIKPVLSGCMEDYKAILNVDLHTGYGARGKLHLFIDKPEDEGQVRAMESVFKGSSIDWGNGTDFYTSTGEYTKWVGSLVPGKVYVPMLFEYGTMDSQKTFGSLKSMQIMILENQGNHYGFKTEDDRLKVKQLFDELYYPASPAWRSKVISDSDEMIRRMIGNFEIL